MSRRDSIRLPTGTAPLQNTTWTGWRGQQEPEQYRPTPDGSLWPYGPPEAHEDVCWLFDGGRYCDCRWSCHEDG